MQVNKKVDSIFNNEGVVAKHISPELQLRRSVMATMLWEDGFYEDGKTVSSRIVALIPQVDPQAVYDIAIEARLNMKLRHIPLFIAREMARLETHKCLVATLLPQIIQRADELTEFLAMYWVDNGGKKTLSAQVKKGLARSFSNFSEYELAKYNRDKSVKLRDVMFLSHAKPAGSEKRYTKLERKLERDGGKKKKLTENEMLFLRVVEDKLQTPDTWEVGLSGGADKKETFERLLIEKKLGALAFLKNLRNMSQSGVDKKLIQEYALSVKTDRVLPFRFISAARAVPGWENLIEPMMFRCLDVQEKITGKTVLLVDTSPSMCWAISSKSDVNRKDAALGLAILLASVCDDLSVYAFSSGCKIVPSRKGFALGDAIDTAVQSNGTLLGRSINTVSGQYERLIVITDEESQDAVPNPDRNTKSYMINVANTKNGVGYGAWTHIDGFSEAIIDYIREFEKQNLQSIS